MGDLKGSCGSPIEDAIHFLLECQLYYNQRISLFNDLINMNIEINIETLLFGNNTYTDQTISKNFEKVLFLLNRQRCCTPNSAALECCYILLF